MNRLSKLILRNIVSHEETIYDFRTGKPIIIVGENLDNPSQKGNGAGKSGIGEGISLAFTGDTIRPITKKKIVRRGCEYGEVELWMYNAMYRNDIHIWRRFYSGSKSAEVKIWCNEEPIELSDTDAYTKWIFESLAISKEDFFSFYLIGRKEDYKPFLLVGDTGKKEIINRFSGAEKIDLVEPAIDTDVKEKATLVKVLNDSITIKKGKVELISEQIEKEEAKFTLEAFEQLKQLTEQELVTLLESAETYKVDIDSLTREWDNVVNKLEVKIAQKPDYAKYLNEKEQSQKTKQALTLQKKNQMPAVKDQFKDEIEKIKYDEDLNTQTLNRYSAEQKEAQSIEADLNKSLAGTIDCPKCAHKFILADGSFDVKAAIRELKEVKDILDQLSVDIEFEQLEKSRIAVRKQKINEKVVSAGETLRKEIEKINIEILQLGEEIKVIQKEKRDVEFEISQLQVAVEKLKRDIQWKTEEQEAILDKADLKEEEIANMKPEESQVLEQYQEQLMTFMDEEIELNEKLERAIIEQQKYEAWYINFKNFKSYLANQSIRNVQDYTNMYLQQMQSDITIAIDGYKLNSKGKITEKITTTVERGGFPEDEYGTFSGGERGRIDVACILAIQMLINLNSTSGGLDLLYADEIFDSIDALGLEMIIKGLEYTERTTIFVSQVEVNSLQDQTLKIRKQNKISKIV